MFESIWMDITWIASVVASLTAVSLALVAMLRVRRHTAQMQRFLQRLEQSQQMTNSGAVGMGRRLIAVEKTLQRLQQTDAGAVVTTQATASAASKPAAADEVIAPSKAFQEFLAQAAAGQVASASVAEATTHTTSSASATKPLESVIPERTAPEPMPPEFADAARLLDAGVQVDEVARRCGMSRAETALMKLMHARLRHAAA